MPEAELFYGEFNGTMGPVLRWNRILTPEEREWLYTHYAAIYSSKRGFQLEAPWVRESYRAFPGDFEAIQPADPESSEPPANP